MEWFSAVIVLGYNSEVTMLETVLLNYAVGDGEGGLGEDEDG